LILPKELEQDWLNPVHEKADQELIEAMTQPYDEAKLEAFTVRRLRGKEAIGNKPEAVQPFHYPELDEIQGSLF